MQDLLLSTITRPVGLLLLAVASTAAACLADGGRCTAGHCCLTHVNPLLLLISNAVLLYRCITPMPELPPVMMNVLPDRSGMLLVENVREPMAASYCVQLVPVCPVVLVASLLRNRVGNR